MFVAFSCCFVGVMLSFGHRSNVALKASQHIQEAIYSMKILNVWTSAHFPVLPAHTQLQSERHMSVDANMAFSYRHCNGHHYTLTQMDSYVLLHRAAIEKWQRHIKNTATNNVMKFVCASKNPFRVEYHTINDAGIYSHFFMCVYNAVLCVHCTHYYIYITTPAKTSKLHLRDALLTILPLSVEHQAISHSNRFSFIQFHLHTHTTRNAVAHLCILMYLGYVKEMQLNSPRYVSK